MMSPADRVFSDLIQIATKQAVPIAGLSVVKHTIISSVVKQ